MSVLSTVLHVVLITWQLRAETGISHTLLILQRKNSRHREYDWWSGQWRLCHTLASSPTNAADGSLPCMWFSLSEQLNPLAFSSCIWFRSLTTHTYHFYKLWDAWASGSQKIKNRCTWNAQVHPLWFGRSSGEERNCFSHILFVNLCMDQWAHRLWSMGSWRVITLDDWITHFTVANDNFSHLPLLLPALFLLGFFPPEKE